MRYQAVKFDRCSLIHLLSLTKVRFGFLSKQFLRLWWSFRFHRITSFPMQFLGANVFFCVPFSHLLQRFLLSTIMRWNRAWAPQHEVPLQTLTKLNKLFHYYIILQWRRRCTRWNPWSRRRWSPGSQPAQVQKNIWFDPSDLTCQASLGSVVSKSGRNNLNTDFFSFVGPSLRVNYLCMFVKLLNSPVLPWPPNWWLWARSPPTGQSGTAGRTGSWPLWK